MNYLKPLVGAALLCLMLPLAGCTTLGDVINDIGTVANTKIVNPINNSEVTQLGNLLGTAQGAVVGYAALPLCPVGHAISLDDWCHDKHVLIALDADMHLALATYTKLTAFQTSNPQGTVVVGGGFSSLYSQAKSAIAAVQSLVAAYKIGG